MSTDAHRHRLLRELIADFLRFEDSPFALEASLSPATAANAAAMLDRAASALKVALDAALDAPFFYTPHLPPRASVHADISYDQLDELTRNVCRLARLVEPGAYVCRWLVVVTGDEQPLPPHERTRDRRRQLHVAAFRTLAVQAAHLAGLVDVGDSDDEVVDTWLDYVREEADYFDREHEILEHPAKASASVCLSHEPLPSSLLWSASAPVFDSHQVLPAPVMPAPAIEPIGDLLPTAAERQEQQNRKSLDEAITPASQITIAEEPKRTDTQSLGQQLKTFMAEVPISIRDFSAATGPPGRTAIARRTIERHRNEEPMGPGSIRRYQETLSELLDRKITFKRKVPAPRRHRIGKIPAKHR